MPEIGEVARIVSYIHKYLVGKTLSVVKAQHDENVFGKVGTSAAELEKALTGKKVLDAKQQGKYFWLVMSSPPHPLCHFGMAGWFKIRGVETAYYKPTNPPSPSEWPPKYWKFTLETLETPKCEAAFVDFRRFARVRLIDCAAEDIRNTTPLKENGPDPVIDKDIVTVDWLSEKLRSKKIPVKALLLDQANISGIGNWVGDEVLYDAKIHPEQYSNSLSDAQIEQLHKSIHYVCSLAVETKADSSLFPDHWLFKHRWQKGKKDAIMKLPNGAKIVFLTVGGRTSAVIPSVQKKTGPVAGNVKGAKKEVKDESEVEEKPKRGTKRAAPKKEEEEEEDEDEDKHTSEAEINPKKKQSSQGAKSKTTKPIANGNGVDSASGEKTSKTSKPKTTGKGQELSPPNIQPPTDETKPEKDISPEPSTEDGAPGNGNKRRKATPNTQNGNARKKVTENAKNAPEKQKQVIAKDASTTTDGRRRSARVSGAK